jgi:hypothetical protein
MVINGNGKMIFYEVRTGYGSQVLIRYFTEERVNNTQKYVMPPLILTLDCCESECNKLKLDLMPLAVPIKHVIPHTHVE